MFNFYKYTNAYTELSTKEIDELLSLNFLRIIKRAITNEYFEYYSISLIGMVLILLNIIFIFITYRKLIKQMQIEKFKRIISILLFFFPFTLFILGLFYLFKAYKMLKHFIIFYITWRGQLDIAMVKEGVIDLLSSLVFHFLIILIILFFYFIFNVCNYYIFRKIGYRDSQSIKTKRDI